MSSQENNLLSQLRDTVSNLKNNLPVQLWNKILYLIRELKELGEKAPESIRPLVYLIQVLIIGNLILFLTSAMFSIGGFNEEASGLRDISVVVNIICLIYTILMFGLEKGGGKETSDYAALVVSGLVNLIYY